MTTPCRLLMPFAALSLGACAMFPGRLDPEWPPELPARAYFEAQYRADPANARVQTEEEYLVWVRRFYLGSELYPYGFRDLESLVLSAAPQESAARIAGKLRRLGRSIAGDWAKHRSADYITTAMLAAWAGALQSAVPAGRSEAVVDQVAADVRALLAGRLAEAAIVSGRYGDQPELAYHESCEAETTRC